MFKTDLAYENWAGKYRYGNETPIETFKRVSRALATVEKSDREEWSDRFLRTLVKFDKNDNPVGLKCTTGGRITANIGTSYKNATLLNCFVSSPVSGATINYKRHSEDGSVEYPVKIQTDDTPDDLVNIYLTLLEQAKTLASEGGYGINFDFIRPRGSIIKGTGIKHPGVLSYMKIWDASAECIVKGDKDGYVDKIRNYLISEEEFNKIKEIIIKLETRKGAMMGVLSVNHPDIEEFIRAKQQSGVLTKFNMSVLITNDFMQAVEKDDFFDLTFHGVLYKRVKARDLYDLIMESNYKRGEPGVLFVDNMHSNNPVAYLGKCTCVNPCLHGSSLFLTKDGLKTVESLSGEKVVIWNGIEWVQSDFFYTGVKPVYEIKMSNGMVVKSTLDHILGGVDGQFSAAEAIDKEIARVTGSDWTGIPADLTEDQLFCLGFIFGKGGFLRASNKYKYVYIFGDEGDSDVEAVFERLGEDLAKIGPNGKRKLSFGLAALCNLLEYPNTSPGKRDLPDRVMQLPPKQLKLFLKGLFSANGTVVNGGVVLKLANKDVARKIQVILMAMGIHSSSVVEEDKRINFNNGNYIIKNNYNIHISSLDLFKDQIGFVQKCYNEKVGSDKKVETPKVVGIKLVGEEKVYDFTEPNTHWAFVNGLKIHNCGEVPGLTSLTTVCLLGSLNVTQYVEIVDGKPVFDMESYKNDIVTFARMLDDINDLTNSVLPGYAWATKNLRQFGMGLNGLGSALMMLKIPYNSKEAVDFTAKLTQIKENLTWQASALLAAEKGVFPAYDKEKFEATEYFRSDRLWEETKDMLRKHGARNAKTTTNPPLGNCVIGSTEIRTSEGLKRIEDLFKENTEGLTVLDNTWYIPVKEICADTLFGPKRITGYYYKGISDVLEITSKDHKKITGTSEHKVLVRVSENTAVWKKLSDLKIGDKIMLSPNRQ